MAYRQTADFAIFQPRNVVPLRISSLSIPRFLPLLVSRCFLNTLNWDRTAHPPNTKNQTQTQTQTQIALSRRPAVLYFCDNYRLRMRLCVPQRNTPSILPHIALLRKNLLLYRHITLLVVGLQVANYSFTSTVVFMVLHSSTQTCCSKQL